ncbi:MAG: type II toxin-antitoxin system RelE/ParE family toxin [Flavobacteriales bacterium]|jgi:toxin ParE1/3/4
MNFKISKAAAKDLESIWLYTLEFWSAEKADRYIQLIIDEINFLCEHPHSGSDFTHIRKGYFRSKVKSHFIFYRVNEVKSQLEVIRILHQQMDIENRLNE